MRFARAGQGDMKDYGPILGRLEGLRPYGSKPNAWKAKCPVHGDQHHSLSVWVDKDCNLHAKCHANHGCSFREIAAAIGTKQSDWFPDEGRRMDDVKRKVVATYKYKDREGKLLFEVVRYEPKGFAQRRPDGEGRYSWDVPANLHTLYRLPELLASARAGQPVLVVEGEKDADRLAQLGLVATTNPCGAGKWKQEYAVLLKGRRVAILPDNDAPGWNHAWLVAGSCMAAGAASVRVVGLPEMYDTKGDVSDWLENYYPTKGKDDGFKRAALIEAIKQAQEWKPVPAPGKEVVAEAA